MHKIMIVEDDESISSELKELLQNSGYEVVVLQDFNNSLNEILRVAPDLLLMDINIPYVNGELLLQCLRKSSNIPVIMVTSKNNETDEALSISYGADDYITKPFYHEEVLARIESVLRRCSESPQTEYSFKDIRINVDDHKVLVNNTELTLTTTEYNLLQLLIKHPKQTFTKESLYQLIWGKDYISDDNTLNVHISNLRKKLEHIGNQAPYIDTVWGIGYKLHR